MGSAAAASPSMCCAVSAETLRRPGSRRGLAEALPTLGSRGGRAAVRALARSATPARRAGTPTSTEAWRQPMRRSARSLRVDVERIDALVNLAGELTVVKNALGHPRAWRRPGRRYGWPSLKDQHARLRPTDGGTAPLGTGDPGAAAGLRLPGRFPRWSARWRSLGKARPPGHRRRATPRPTRPWSRACSSPCCTSCAMPSTMASKAPEARAAAGKPDDATIRCGRRREGEQGHGRGRRRRARHRPARVRAAPPQRGVATAEALAAMAG